MRVRRPELMDDPAIDAASHEHALAGLARINRLSAAARAVANSVLDAELPADASVLDVATGSADLPIALARRAHRRAMTLRLAGSDCSAQALGIARARADQAGVPIELLTLDILRDPLPLADVVTCSLFLHHLDESECEHALRAMAGAAQRLLVINDLRRCIHGTALARIIPRIVTRSPVVHVDALRSAQAALTVPELRTIADRAGLAAATITTAFPARMRLVWRRPT